jgi:hypothetical protein
MTIKESITIDETIDLLNELLKLDKSAISALVLNHKNPCNRELAEHPTVQVTALMDGNGYHVGLLGIINGMFGTFPDGWGPIMVIIDKKENLVLYFERVWKEEHIISKD